jgi:TonB family protein
MVNGLVLLAALSLAQATPAGAGGTPAEPQAESAAQPGQGVLTRAPELVRFVEAAYPPDAAAAGSSGAVELAIVISADGKVTDARVTDPGPHPSFAPAALEAVRQFEFRPAEIDGQPAAVEIAYRYEFTLRPVTAEPAQGPVLLDGKVIERGTRSPVAGATVAAGDVSAITGPDGGFELRGLVPGKVHLRILSSAHRPFEVEEELADGMRRTVEYRLTRRRTDPYEAVVQGDRERRDISVHSLSVDEVRNLPGTQGDVLKVLQNFPGVARAPFGMGQLVVRGSSPADTKVYLDQVEIPIAYHFGGLASVVSGEVLSGLDFYPGNFDARFGRAMGGTVDLRTREPRREFHGDAQLDIYGGNFLLEGPLGAGSFFVAGRRAWIDVVLDRVLANRRGGIIASPVYWDYQAKLVEPLLGGSLSITADGSNDTFHLILTRSLGPPPTYDSQIAFHRLAASWERPLGPGLTNRATLALGYDLQTNRTNSDLDVSVKSGLVSLRDALAWRWSEALSMEVGLDAQLHRFQYDLLLPPASGPGSISGEPPQSTRASGWSTTPSAYLEVRAQPWQPLRLVPSLRLEGDSRTRGRFQLDPRLSAFWDLRPGTTLTAAVGLYSEAPQPSQTVRLIGNPDLGFQRAVHYSAGVQQDLPWSTHLDLTGFFKDLRQIVTSTRALNADGTPLRLSNTGRGEVLGLEFLLRRQLARGLYGWLAYSWSRSLRLDDPTSTTWPDWFLYRYDQTHNLTLVLSYRTENDWTFGGRVRYTSGDPYTPVAGRVFDTDLGRYQCIPGAYNTRRLSPFFQADLRVDKRWTFDRWMFSGYIDVQNVTNRANPEFTTPSGSCDETVTITGLPILPTIGVRAEW